MTPTPLSWWGICVRVCLQSVNCWMIFWCRTLILTHPLWWRNIFQFAAFLAITILQGWCISPTSKTANYERNLFGSYTQALWWFQFMKKHLSRLQSPRFFSTLTNNNVSHGLNSSSKSLVEFPQKLSRMKLIILNEHVTHVISHDAQGLKCWIRNWRPSSRRQCCCCRCRCLFVCLFVLFCFVLFCFVLFVCFDLFCLFCLFCSFCLFVCLVGCLVVWLFGCLFVCLFVAAIGDSQQSRSLL